MHDNNRMSPHVLASGPFDLEAEFSRRVLASERWRAQILFLLLLFVLLLHLVLPWFGALGTYLRNEALLYEVGATVMVAAAFFELYCWTVCDRYLREDRLPPMMLRYVHALVETSFPTVTLYFALEMMTPREALGSPFTSSYYFFVLLAALRLDFGICLFTGLVAAAGFSAVFVLSPHAVPQGVLLTVAVKVSFLFACSVLSGFVSRHIRQNLLRSMEAVAEKKEVVDIFSQLVSPQVAHELLSQRGGIGSEVRDVTILVVDIRDFTSLAEITHPDDLVEYLNIVWGAGVRVVNHHGGVINKFLGDGFMAVFGAPVADERHAEKAVWAGLNLLGEMEKLHASTFIPETRLGIGIHSGPALLGIIGAEDRREYTVIGDTVNVAFRIEQLNKEFDSQLLISEAVRRRAGEIARDAEPLQHMFVRGRSGAVQAYRIV